MVHAVKRLVLGLGAGLALGGCLAAAPPSMPAPAPAPLAANAKAAETARPRFEEAIAAFEAADKLAMPPKCATLFVGSSTIRFWSSLKEDFPNRQVINRGFGGSTVWEVDDYFARVVTPYQPAAIVFYAGDTDLAAGHTPDQVYGDFLKFMKLKDDALAKTPVWFIAVKPSKLRWDIEDKMTAVNNKVIALADRRDDLAYIDIVPVMLKPDGTPKDIFREDRLHMLPEGYALWTPIVTKALNEGQKAKAPGC